MHRRLSLCLSIALKALAVTTLVLATVRFTTADVVLGSSPPAIFWVLGVARVLAGLEALTCPTSSSHERPAALNLFAALLTLTTASLMVATVAMPPLPSDHELRKTFDRTYCSARALDACKTDGTSLQTYAALFSDADAPPNPVKPTPGIGGTGPRRRPRRRLENASDDDAAAHILSDTLHRCRSLLLTRRVWSHDAAPDVAGRAVDDGNMQVLELFPPSDTTDAWCGAYLRRGDVAKYLRPDSLETMATATQHQSPFDAHYVGLRAYVREKRSELPMDWWLQWIVMALRLGIVVGDVVAAVRRSVASTRDARSYREDDVADRKRAVMARGESVEGVV
ncbi:hypothetical protein PINS_up010653 [Pythium insidiosum]|nr:hypothetical protein PINS_up010653 [Pythium insidiosum]